MSKGISDSELARIESSISWRPAVAGNFIPVNELMQTLSELGYVPISGKKQYAGQIPERIIPCDASVNESERSCDGLRSALDFLVSNHEGVFYTDFVPEKSGIDPREYFSPEELEDNPCYIGYILSSAGFDYCWTREVDDLVSRTLDADSLKNAYDRLEKIAEYTSKGNFDIEIVEDKSDSGICGILGIDEDIRAELEDEFRKLDSETGDSQEYPAQKSNQKNYLLIISNSNVNFNIFAVPGADGFNLRVEPFYLFR